MSRTREKVEQKEESCEKSTSPTLCPTHTSEKIFRGINCKKLDCNLIEYLRDEITRIITINDDPDSHHVHFKNHVSIRIQSNSGDSKNGANSTTLHEPLFIRLINLLDRMRYHFGPDPVNPCFKRFLRISLKSCSYKVSHFLIKHYLKIDELINYFNFNNPDYLFLLFFYSKHSQSAVRAFNQRGEFGSFLNLVKLLIPISDINGFYSGYNLSLLQLIISCLDPDNVKHHTKLGIAAEITFYYLITYCSDIIDVNLTQAKLNYSFCSNLIIANPLQVALNEGKFRAASKLIQSNIAVKDINLSNVLFTGSSSCIVCYKYLYHAGYVFPPVDIFKSSNIDLYDHDPSFDLFCKWLGQQQSKVPSLMVLSWNSIKEIEPRSDLLLKNLSLQVSFPDSFINFASLSSFEIFDQ